MHMVTNIVKCALAGAEALIGLCALSASMLLSGSGELKEENKCIVAVAVVNSSTFCSGGNFQRTVFAIPPTKDPFEAALRAHSVWEKVNGNFGRELYTFAPIYSTSGEAKISDFFIEACYEPPEDSRDGWKEYPFYFRDKYNKRTHYSKQKIYLRYGNMAAGYSRGSQPIRCSEKYFLNGPEVTVMGSNGDPITHKKWTIYLLISSRNGQDEEFLSHVSYSFNLKKNIYPSGTLNNCDFSYYDSRSNEYFNREGFTEVPGNEQ